MKIFLVKLAVCFVLICYVFWYGQSHFYRDPGSIFYDQRRAFEKKYTTHRTIETENFIQSQLEEAPSNVLRSGSKPVLCAAFSSVNRETQYLDTALGSLLQGLSPQERRDLYVSILIAEPNPITHPSWHSPWIGNAVDDMHTYDLPEDSAYLENLQKSGNYSEKGIYDYNHVLQRCYETGTPYIAIFEDDILFAEGWFITALIGLRNIKKENQGTWLFMRLFNQERSTGWATRRIGGNNEHWIILGIGTSILASALLLRRLWRPAQLWIDPTSLAVILVILVPSLVVLFFQSGKASLLPPSPGVVQESFGCCSQAMIYPREEVLSLVNYLKFKGKGQIDLLLDEYAIEKGLARYALYPVQVQHIGQVSSRGTTNLEAQSIWSMAFEDLDSLELKEHHTRMVQYYYTTA